MKIIGVTCVKNEEDIIEAFIRHNLFYLQKLIVVNHGSTDNTSSILTRLVAEGLSLVVEDDPSLGKLQLEKMTRLMHLAATKYEADWVLLLDGDEFIRCSGDRLILPDPKNFNGFLKVGWRTYQARPSDDSSNINPVNRIQHRLVKEPYEDDTLDKRSHLLKAVVPGSLARLPEASVSQGNHLVFILNQQPSYTFWPDFEYAHFSLRSAGQYSAKVAISSLQEAYRSSHRGANSSHYLMHLEELKTDFMGFCQRFYDLIPSYMEGVAGFSPTIIYDPFNYRGGELRYTSLTSDYSRLVTNLIGYTEVLVREAAAHASVVTSKTNQVEELARVELSGESGKVFTQTISATSLLLQIVRFPMESVTASHAVNLRIVSFSAVVEIVKMRLIWADADAESVLSGKGLHENTLFVQNALRLPHDQYINFIKGSEDAVVAFKAPQAGAGRVLNAIEISIQMEVDPTRIGAKLLQSNVINGVIAATRPIAQLENRVSQLGLKLEQRTTLLGACGFQFYRLWRAVSRPFKKSSNAGKGTDA